MVQIFGIALNCSRSSFNTRNVNNLLKILVVPMLLLWCSSLLAIMLKRRKEGQMVRANIAASSKICKHSNEVYVSKFVVKDNGRLKRAQCFSVLVTKEYGRSIVAHSMKWISSLMSLHFSYESTNVCKYRGWYCLSNLFNTSSWAMLLPVEGRKETSVFSCLWTILYVSQMSENALYYIAQI